MKSENEKQVALTTTTDAVLPKVQRSAVPTGKGYAEYRNYLRHDFFYACAYCQTCEAEAAAVKFTIDHYEPQKARPDLVHEYSNLMYCCERCNTLKGVRSPSESERAKGFRIYRMDADIYTEHFAIDGVFLKNVSPTGWYTIHACDLNRQALRRLRDLRRRMADCDALVAEGLLGLKHFHIDRLPPFVRGQVVNAIKDANKMVTNISSALDEHLRENMRSSLVDDDPDFEDRAKERSKALKGISALAPGMWKAALEGSANKRSS